VTSNLWTMGQQFYVIRNNPAPGTPAAAAKAERDAAKAKRHGVLPHLHKEQEQPEEPSETEEPPAPRRQQPKKQSRSQRKTKGPAQGRSTPGEPDTGSDAASG
jgi:YidC/Oxa1 family membrane protein insertase